MTKTLKNTALGAALIAIACASLFVGGMLFYFGTAPEAHAGAPRVVASPPNPVTTEMQQGLTRDVNGVITCLGTRLFDARAETPGIGRMEDANNAAGWAAANRDLAAWNTAAANARAEIPAIKAKYGC
jgi:hypothetical protein